VNSTTPRETLEKLYVGLERLPLQCTLVGDLCGLAAQGDSRLKEILFQDDLVVMACHPRAVRSLVQRLVCPCRANTIRIHDLRHETVEEILAALGNDGGKDAGNGGPTDSHVTVIPWERDWIPWFPVIDKDRCSSCLQCLRFCLFGVYELSEESQVVVSRPHACKTYCPACARVCPDSAIMFPKHEDPGIHGDLIGISSYLLDHEETLDLLSHGAMDALERHSRKRKRNLLNKRRVEQALREREACTCEPEDGTGETD